MSSNTHQALLFCPPPCSCLMHLSLRLHSSLLFFSSLLISFQPLPSSRLLLMCYWSLEITGLEAEALNTCRCYIKAWHHSRLQGLYSRSLKTTLGNFGCRQHRAICVIVYCCPASVYDLEVHHWEGEHCTVCFKNNTNGSNLFLAWCNCCFSMWEVYESERAGWMGVSGGHMLVQWKKCPLYFVKGRVDTLIYSMCWQITWTAVSNSEKMLKLCAIEPLPSDQTWRHQHRLSRHHMFIDSRYFKPYHVYHSLSLSIE